MTSQDPRQMSYEQMLARKKELQRLAELAGKAGMARLIHRAAFSRDPFFYNHLKQYFSAIPRRREESL